MNASTHSRLYLSVGSGLRQKMDSSHHNNHTDGRSSSRLFRLWSPRRLDWPETNLLYIHSYPHHFQYRRRFLCLMGNVCLCPLHVGNGCGCLCSGLPEHHIGIRDVNVATYHIWDSLLVCRGRINGLSHISFQVLEDIACSVSGGGDTCTVQLVVSVNQGVVLLVKFFVCLHFLPFVLLLLYFTWCTM